MPQAEAGCEILLIKAMDAMMEGSAYLAGRSYNGERRTKEQALPFPRVGMVVERWPIAEDEIPRQAVQAQCALAIDVQVADLLPLTEANAPGPVTGEAISGAVSVTYANPGIVSRVPASAKADALLRTLLRRSGLFGVRA